MEQQNPTFFETPQDQEPDGVVVPIAGSDTQPQKPELVDDDKAGRIRGIVEAGLDGAPDVIFSFSGGIKQHDSAETGFRTLAYSDLSEHGLVTGSRTRVIATAEIAEVFPHLPIVTNSFNRFDATEPTMASVVEKELVDRGIDSERILREERSFSTITQLIEMVRESNSHEWAKLVVVGNEWHFPRMEAMFNNLETVVRYADAEEDAKFKADLQKFRDRKVMVNFVASEAVMRAANDHYGTYLDAAEQTEGFSKSIAAEVKGLADLEAGVYHVTLQPEKARDNNR